MQTDIKELKAGQERIENILNIIPATYETHEEYMGQQDKKSAILNQKILEIKVKLQN